MKYKNLTLNIENDPRIQQLFSAVFELMPLMPHLEKLIDEATRNGPITVDFVTRDTLHTTGSYEERGEICGNIKTLYRSIKVAKDGQSFKDMFEILIFELCNAKNPNFQLFGPQHISPEKFNNREEYALATEFAEYSQTHVPAKELLKELFSHQWLIDAFAIKGLRLNHHELRNLTTDYFGSFNAWWQHVNRNEPNKNYSHSDIYREQFDKKVKKPASAPAQKPLAQKPLTQKPLAQRAPQFVITPLYGLRDRRRCGNHHRQHEQIRRMEQPRLTIRLNT